jgi:4-amino-4-deoxy-L-arabinose transferase-like glycosyltransferase
MTRRELVAVGGVVAAYLAFAALTLLDYPPVYSDEPWLLSTPISLLRHGENALPLFGEDYNASIYFSAYLVPFLAVLGVSMEAARIAAVLHGAGALVVTWMLARKLGAGSRAWLAPALLVAMYPFVEVSRYVRPESFEIFYALLALALYLHGRARSPLWLLGSGVSAGIAFGLFFQGAWVVLVLAAWAVVDLRRDLRRAAALGAGAAVAVLPLTVFIALDPPEYGRYLRKFGNSSIFAERYFDRGPIGSIGDLVSAETQRYERYLTAVGSRWYVVALLLAVGLAFAALRHESRTRLLPLLLLPPALLALLGANKTPAYLVIAAPPVAVAVALSLRRAPTTMGVALAAALCLSYAGVVRAHSPVVDMSFAELRDAYRAVGPLPAGSLVIGVPTHYAYFLDQDLDFRSVHYFTDFDTFELDTLAEAEAKLDRDGAGRRVYLFRSAGLLATLATFAPDQRLPPAFEAFLRDRFRSVARLELTGTAYGDYDDELTAYERVVAR